MTKGWADSVECYCHLRNIQDLLSDGKTPYERRFGIQFNGQVIPFGAMVDYHPISAEDLSRLHQFGPKVLPRIFLGYVFRGENLAAVDKEWEKLEKIPAWDITKARNKSEVIDEARTKGIKVHFASLMDICHLKKAALEAKHQKYKGRVVLRGDIVKDDSGSYAVCTEQGSSASQMTAPKVMDIISRLPGCDGQAADAVSAKTQVKMEDAHKLFKKKSKIGVSRHLDSSTTTQMA